MGQFSQKIMAPYLAEKDRTNVRFPRKNKDFPENNYGRKGSNLTENSGQVAMMKCYVRRG